MTPQAQQLLEEIQQQIFKLECSGDMETSNRIMHLVYLEDVAVSLKSGAYQYDEAIDALEAGTDLHFGKSANGKKEHRSNDTTKSAEPVIEPEEIVVSREPASFPLDTLRPGFRAYAEAVATGTLTDTTTAGSAVLGGVSAVVGTRIHVRISSSWCYHSGLYVSLLAPSSYGKSSVIEAVDQPVRTLEAQLRVETASEVSKNRETLIYIEADIKAKNSLLSSALKKGEGAGNLPSEIAKLEQEALDLKGKSTPPALVADDFTPEAVTDMLEANDERVCVTSGDTGIFNVQRYGDNTSIELLLKCWKGEPHREMRRGRDRDADLQRPSMAMLVATQVENVKALAAKNAALVTRGLLPRFLPVIPEDTIGFRNVKKAILEGRGIPKTLQTKFNEQLVNLARSLQANEGGAVELELDEDAMESWGNTCQGYEHRMRPGGDLRPILEAAGKLPLQLTKLIGINWAMRACEGDVSVIVTADIVADATAQMDYFIDQQHKLYDAICQAPVDALADKVRHWCGHHPKTTVTVRDLRRGVARHQPKQLFDEVLDMLGDEGVIAVLRIKTGGRPSEKVTVL